MKLLNWELIANPLNWVIVVLMVLIAGTAVHLVTNHFVLANAGGPSNAANASSPNQRVASFP